ncbi:MAG: hypothetical protein KGJ86_01305 [Chloroflexota bacterium]|nr:hypothetical protein [Chloroflexota bacterium]
MEEALAGIRQSLVADGYDLRIDGLEGGRLRLSILAGPEACEECLVPKDLMKRMLMQCLESSDEVQDIELHYPAEH